MSYVISVYSRDYGKDYLLPPLQDSDHTLLLPCRLFGLTEDLPLSFEVIGTDWYLKTSGRYRVFTRQECRKSVALQPGLLLRLQSLCGHQLAMRFRYVEAPLHPFHQYDISGLSQITLGKSAQNMICYDSENIVSREHAVLWNRGDGWALQIMGRNGVYINQNPAAEGMRLRFGDTIHLLGLKMVFLGDRLAIDGSAKDLTIRRDILKPLLRPAAQEGRVQNAAGNPQAEEAIAYEPAPRPMALLDKEPIQIQAPAANAPKAAGEWLLQVGPAVTMLLPLALGFWMMRLPVQESGGGANAYYYGMAISLLSGLFGLGWSVLRVVMQKRREQAAQRQKDIWYRAYLEGVRHQLCAVRDQYVDELKQRCPPLPDQLMEWAVRGQVWNRRSDQEDDLQCRVGVGETPFPRKVSLLTQGAAQPWEPQNEALMQEANALAGSFSRLAAVPLVLDLKQYRCVGLIGGADKQGAFGLARWICMQLCAGYPRTALRLAVLYDGSSSLEQGQWAFARWLPHIWSDGQRQRLLGGNVQQWREIIGVLEEELQEAQQSPTETCSGVTEEVHRILVVADANMIRQTPSLGMLLSKAREGQLSAIVLARTFEELPGVCDYVLQKDETQQRMFPVVGTPGEGCSVGFDQLSDTQAEQMGRALARLAGRLEEAAGGLPDQISLFELYGITRPPQLQIAKRWRKNRTYEHIRGLIGVQEGFLPCTLDLHERGEGPHGLVAGTTGSGKSELLETLILSLAINYSPEDLAFFLIDYKGSSMAQTFRQLPHLSGEISNLSGSLIHRALVAIKSELRRRQACFASHGVSHIDAYTRLRKHGTVKQPLPHLILIIDEFAELKKEEPEFMGELISVAQVGRSLGIHLILATQKPGGTVDEHIRSNARFRIGLRMQSREDSFELLGRPDAATLTAPGRGYLQVGSDEKYTLFQAGYGGLPFVEGKAGAAGQKVKLLTEDGKEDPAGTLLAAWKREQARNDAAADMPVSEMEAIIMHLADMAKREGKTGHHSIWMPVLPRVIDTKSLPKVPEEQIPEGRGTLRICQVHAVIGLMDDPRHQRQLPLVISSEPANHLAVIGGTRSGKSIFLETLIYELIFRYTPEQVQLYGIDFDSLQGLQVFAAAPHTGGIVTEEQTLQAEKLWCLLEEIAGERRLLRRRMREEKADAQAGLALPVILVVIDDYGRFSQQTEGRYEERFWKLLKEGAGLGIWFVVTAGGIGPRELPARLMDRIPDRICLSLPDRFAYGDVLHLARVAQVPEAGIPGRGLLARQQEALEFQTGMVCADREADQRRLVLQTQIKEGQSGWAGRRPVPIPFLPEQPLWTWFMQLPQVSEGMQGDDPFRWLPVGFDRRTGKIWQVPLRELTGCVITGTRGSGRRNFLRVILGTALARGLRVYLFGKHFLRDDCSRHEALCMVNTAEGLEELTMALFPMPTASHRANPTSAAYAGLQTAGNAPGKTAKKDPPAVILTGDLADLLEAVEASAAPVREAWSAYLEDGLCLDVFVFGILQPDSYGRLAHTPMFTALLGGSMGVRFGGNAGEDLLLSFDFLDYETRTKILPPGIGLLTRPGNPFGTTQLLVPLMDAL